MNVQSDQKTAAVGLLPRQCPVCGSNDTTHVFAEANLDFTQWDRFAFSSRKLPDYTHFRLMTCPICQLLYANPIPTLDTLAQNYQDADFDTPEEEDYASRTYGRLAKHLLGDLPDLNGSLDIGTGTGSFLQELLTLGFTNVMGVEPSRAPVDQARANVRPLIKIGLFDPKDYKADSLSLVSCFQTLEHLYDPLGMTQAAYRLLKPNGAVLFVFHNRESISARILGLKSPIFDVEHMQLFSPASARYMLEKCGFSDVRTRPVINSYPLGYWFRLVPFPPAVKTSLLTLLKKMGLASLPLPLPAGNLAVVGFKRI